MADPEHVERLRWGSRAWNAWREGVNSAPELSCADLTLLRPSDPSFFEGVYALRMGQTPEVSSLVRVDGFPVGGDSLSVTAGIISRIEVSTYDDSMEDLLMAQIDASGNPGNRGSGRRTRRTIFRGQKAKRSLPVNPKASAGKTGDVDRRPIYLFSARS